MVATTGYARRYAMWLLNHPQEGRRPPGRRQRQRRYGPEVQHALFLAWNAANRIWSKRLMPFLPTLLEALERQGHLHLTETCRNQLLSLSFAKPSPRRVRERRSNSRDPFAHSRTGMRPIPAFWRRNGRAHCRSQAEGSFLSTVAKT
jgi:hypothetical protein